MRHCHNRNCDAAPWADGPWCELLSPMLLTQGTWRELLCVAVHGGRDDLCWTHRGVRRGLQCHLPRARGVSRGFLCAPVACAVARSVIVRTQRHRQHLRGLSETWWDGCARFCVRRTRWSRFAPRLYIREGSTGRDSLLFCFVRFVLVRTSYQHLCKVWFGGPRGAETLRTV